MIDENMDSTVDADQEYIQTSPTDSLYSSNTGSKNESIIGVVATHTHTFTHTRSVT